MTKIVTIKTGPHSYAQGELVSDEWIRTSEMGGRDRVVEQAFAEKYGWQPMGTLPYDQTILIQWSDGRVTQDFWYDESKEDWVKARKKTPFHDDDPQVVPVLWKFEDFVTNLDALPVIEQITRDAKVDGMRVILNLVDRHTVKHLGGQYVIEYKDFRMDFERIAATKGETDDDR